MLVTVALESLEVLGSVAGVPLWVLKWAGRELWEEGYWTSEGMLKYEESCWAFRGQ